MWYFVRRWEQQEQPGNGSAWPYSTPWVASQGQVLWDPQMSSVYAQAKAGTEYKLMTQQKPGFWSLRRVVEVWVWNNGRWERWGNYYGPYIKQPTKVEQWTDMHPLGQRYVKVAASGPGRWRTAPGWGVTAQQVWTSEYSMA